MIPDNKKITQEHLIRRAYVYVRQSTALQVENNKESTARQYSLRKRAIQLGWEEHSVVLIDEDLAQSGSVTSTSKRTGFAKMIGEVAMGNIGIILSIEVSRVARSNAEWYRLLDLCSVMDTLISDEEGVYHPGLFNDRLLLGMKGTMAEAELHVIRARLNGGIRNKAARGELRRGLPIGFIWGEIDGEVLKHPDEAVSHTIQTVFEKFNEFGSARRVWLYFRSENLKFPRQHNGIVNIVWEIPTYIMIHSVLKNPVYAGAYVYGKTRYEHYINKDGHLRKRIKKLPSEKWSVFIKDHHKGYIDWKTYEMNQQCLKKNTHPLPHKAGGAIREGAALLQGIAVCGRCGRKLRVYYQGKNSTPGYYCASNNISNGKGLHCLRIGGLTIDRVVAKSLLEAIQPAGIKAAIVAEKHIIDTYKATLKHRQLQVERMQYQVQLAQKRYEAVDPQNRLVARTLEKQWENRLIELDSAKSELTRREHEYPQKITPQQREHIRMLAIDLPKAWDALTTTDRDRKKLIQTVLEEVIIKPRENQTIAHLCLRWRGGTITELKVQMPPRHAPTIRTGEDTIELMRRLACHYKDSTIAGILNRQGRKTAQGFSFTQNRVGNIRRHWNIPKYIPKENQPEGELVTIQKTADILKVAPSTLHRWLNEGIIAGEHITHGAPWQIRITDELKSKFVEQSPEGYVRMHEATRFLGVSRQTVLQRVKRGELEAIHVRKGRRKGLRIKVLDQNPNLFDNLS